MLQVIFNVGEALSQNLLLTEKREATFRNLTFGNPARGATVVTVPAGTRCPHCSLRRVGRLEAEHLEGFFSSSVQPSQSIKKREILRMRGESWLGQL